jgi:hypothetical protein
MWIALFYVVGVVIGLVAIDSGPITRIGLALVWPLGPLAFLVTVAGLLVAAAIAFPWFGLVLAALAAAAWIWF